MGRGFKIFLAVISSFFVLSFLGRQPASAEPRVYLTSKFQFVADEKPVHCNWWNDTCEFGNFFQDSPEARGEYAQFLDLAQWTPYLRWGAVGLLLGYSVITLGSDHNFDGGSAAAFFLVPWITGIIVSNRAKAHLVRAINIINGVPPEQALLRNGDDPWATLDRPRNSRSPEWRAGIFAYSF